MPDDMVWFDKGDVRFMLCTRGVIIHRERVLLFNVVGWDWWGLPGGRVEMQETTEQALVREMQEEISADVRVGRLLWVVENFFNNGERDFHEVGMYYAVTVPEGSPILEEEEHRCQDGPVMLRFRWFPLSELAAITLHPLFLKDGLTRIPEHTEHIVWREGVDTLTSAP